MRFVITATAPGRATKWLTPDTAWSANPEDAALYGHERSQWMRRRPPPSPVYTVAAVPWVPSEAPTAPQYHGLPAGGAE